MKMLSTCFDCGYKQLVLEYLISHKHQFISRQQYS